MPRSSLLAPPSLTVGPLFPETVSRVNASRSLSALTCCLILLLAAAPLSAQPTPAPTPAPPQLAPRFKMRESGLRLERPARSGAFYDVTGRRAAVFGYEHRRAEAWVYPLKILDDFEPSFRVEGYPLEFSGADTLARVESRPEAAVFTYSHAAFTVRQTIFVPHDEPAVVMLFEVDGALPLTLSVSFRPRLRLSWPAGLMTGSLSWDEKARAYFITEESKRFVGVIGCPRARDVSVMPYQEEPRDVPARFVVETTPGELEANYIPVVIAGGVEGREKARATYQRVLGSIPALYERTVTHYEALLSETTSVETPDALLDQAFAWAKVGIDQGVVTNPLLGTGLVAGYRTSGESERLGFAWYFGRDSMWTALATTAYGDWRTTRGALDFLKKFQRADGKIPHEISQSASLLPWFTDYKYAWDSADATPLYVIAHADYWRAGGDRKYLNDNWESILRAYRFTAATDADGNGLVENTKHGHGWVEGGDLYPPHEEVYQQGLWIAASRAVAEMAGALGDEALKARAHAAAERTRDATEKIFWLPRRGFYAYATKTATNEPSEAEKGPNRAARQTRLDELRDASLFDEDTVLPAVPLWFKTLDAARAQEQIDHLGAAALATDWGARILSNESRLYDPLSYHHGSVWPLFTGWASLAAYNHGRPHVGHQALMANALLTYQGSPGHVTELLSGDFNAPFGRSSHHQIWSQAMVAAPLVRGLLGVEVEDEGRALRFAPQVPADWDWLAVRGVRAGNSQVSITLERTPAQTRIRVRRQPRPKPGETSSPSGQTSPPPSETPTRPAPLRLVIAPAFPLDARVTAATVRGQPVKFDLVREGDVQRAVVTAPTPDGATDDTEIVFTHEAGTDVYPEIETPKAGARSEGLRVLRARAEGGALRLLLEGRAGREYGLRVRTPKRLGAAPGVSVKREAGRDAILLIRFDGTGGGYLRRDITVPLEAPTPARHD